MIPDFSTVVGGLAGADTLWQGHVPESWRQGRTAFGGIVAALALRAARSAFPQEPPLRSAQVSFIGPVAGDATFQCTRLRKGRSATFVQVSVSADGASAAECVFCFGAARPSALSFAAPGPADGLAPEDTQSFFANSPRRPTFAQPRIPRMTFRFRASKRRFMP